MKPYGLRYIILAVDNVTSHLVELTLARQFDVVDCPQKIRYRLN